MVKKASLLFISILLFFSASVASGHDFYSNQCCHDMDCHPIADCSEPIEQKDGGYNWGEYHFEKSMIKPSEDNKCHVCIHKYPDMVKPLCVYIQHNT